MVDETDNQDPTAGLKAKNAELISKNKTYQTELEQLRAEKAEREAEAERKAGDFAALEKRLTEKHEKAIKAMQERNDALDAELRTIKVDNELASNYVALNGRPELAPAFSALMKSQAVYENGEATIQGKSIADYVSGYLKTKEGLHFVRADDNSGSGAMGSEAKATQWTRETIMSRATEFGQFAKENPAEAKAIADSVGLHFDL